MTYRVTSEWVALRRNQPFPSIDFLHPRTFSVDWENCALIRSLADTASPPSDTLEFEFIGKVFRKDAPDVEPGRRVSTVPARSLLSLSTPLLPRLFDCQTAVTYSGILPWSGANAIYFRSIAVPFGNNAGDLAYGLVVLSHKLTKTALRPEQAQTEFREFRDGAWRAINVVTERALATG